MVKNKKVYIAISIILILFFLGLKKCGLIGDNFNRISGIFQPNNTACYVHEDATFILGINLANVLEELSFFELVKTRVFKEKLQPSYRDNFLFSKLIEDPILAGVNTSSKAIFVLDVGNNDKEIYTASYIPLLSIDKFKSFIATNWKGKIIEKDSYTYIKINDGSSLAWNENIAVFLTSNHTFDKLGMLNRVFNERKKKYFDEQEQFLKEFNQFSSDFYFWADLASYGRNQLHATGKPGEINSRLLDDNYLSGNVDFGQGFIDANIHTKLNPTIEKFVQSLFNKKTTSGIFKYLPDNRQKSFQAGLSLNFNGILNLMLTSKDLKLQARDSLAAYGLIIDDFDQAFTGNTSFVAYPNDTTYKNSIALGLEIKDKTHFFKIIEVMQDLGKIIPEEGGTYKMVGGAYVPFFPIYFTYPDFKQRMIVKGNMVFFSADKFLIEYLRSSGGEEKLPSQEMEGAYFSLSGYEKPEEVKKYLLEYSVKNYEITYKENNFKIHLDLDNTQKSALKQVFKL